MSAIALGYTLDTASEKRPSIKAQYKAIEAYAAKYHLPLESCFAHAATSRKLPLRERMFGKEMCKDLRGGDHLIVKEVAFAAPSYKEFVSLLVWCKDHDVILHTLDMGVFDFMEPKTRLLLTTMQRCVELETKFRAVTADARKRPAPAGWKHVVRPNHRTGGMDTVIVPDDETRAAMKKAIEWRMAGLTLQGIADRLNKTKWRPRIYGNGRKPQVWSHQCVSNLIRRGLAMLEREGYFNQGEHGTPVKLPDFAQGVPDAEINPNAVL